MKSAPQRGCGLGIAVSLILAACAAMKIAKTEGQIADLGGFAISSRFDAFAQTFKLTIKRQSSYTIELGSDPAGNIQRILNALASSRSGGHFIP